MVLYSPHAPDHGEAATTLTIQCPSSYGLRPESEFQSSIPNHPSPARFMRLPSISHAFLLLALLTVARAPAEVLVDTNATWRLFKGRTEASSPDLTAWRGRNFDDAAFTDAPGPFWYGDVLPGGTQITDMQNSYSCLFLRRTFVVTNRAEIGAVRLGALGMRSRIALRL